MQESHKSLILLINYKHRKRWLCARRALPRREPALHGSSWAAAASGILSRVPTGLRSISTLWVAAVWLLGAPAWAASRAPCPDGVFLTDGKPFATQFGETAAAVISLEAGELEIEGLCDEAALAKVSAKKKFDTAKGKWPLCSAFPGKVKLKAKIDAVSCEDMEGSLSAKGLKPKKQKFTAVRLAPEALALQGTLGSPAVAERMVDENLPFVIHPAAEALNPELAELIALGPDAVPALLAAFRRPATAADETRLALFAVALERIGDARAVPVLADWLEENLFTASVLWAPHLVIHAMKVLGGQSDLDTDEFVYDIDEALDAIARTRIGTPTTALVPNARRRLPRDSHERPSNKCWPKIYVSGTDGAGAPQTLEIAYNLFAKDIDELIAEQPPGPKRDGLVVTRDRFLSRDEDVYGGTDYVPIDPAGEVSIQSNCGGSVIERMLNEVARVNGLSFEIGPGNATARAARDLANTFGGAVALSELEPLLGVISHDSGSDSSHVEVPIERTGPSQLRVYSKDVQGLERQHFVDTDGFVTWDPVVQRYHFKPFADVDGLTTNFFQIDPARVTDIRIDTSACDCRFGTGLDVTLDSPSGDEVDELMTAVAGTVDGAPLVTGNVRVNGKPAQSVEVVSDAFFSDVLLRPGRNELRLSFEAPDGRRGCVERTLLAPCEFTDPDVPFNGGGLVRISVDGGPEIEWPGYTGISIPSAPRKINWFGAPPTSQPHILFELYGPRATRPWTWPVQLRPTSDNAFGRDFAVGTYRSQEAVFGSSFRHQLTAGTLTVEEIETGKERLLSASFDVTAVSDEDGSSKQLRGRVDLCRFGIERRSKISLAD